MLQKTDSTEKLSQLRGILNNLLERNHPYGEKMKVAGVSADQITSFDDLQRLPYMTKQDLQGNYPLGWLACDKKDVVRYHATSGTTGNPTVVAYTKEDLQMWTDAIEWCLTLAGIDHHDTLQVAFGYGLFTGGFGVHYGAEQMGIGVIPASGGFTERQLKLMRDLGTTALACTPSYALLIAETIEKTGCEHPNLRVGIFGAEAWSESLRKELEARLKIKALDLYGLSEAMGPGVGIECLEQNGLHIADSFIPEIIDPETLQNMETGQHGELVLTSWNKNAFPLIRYRTRDLTHIMPDACPCGETTPRIARIQGRSDDMLIIHGVNVFPSMVETALCKVPGLTANYQIQVHSHDNLQEMRVLCEGVEAGCECSENLLKLAKDELRKALGVNVPVEITPPDSIPRSEGKAKRVIRI